MDRDTQREVARQLFTYLNTRSTAMAEHVSLEPVNAYVKPEQAALERQRFFRAQPLILGLSCEVARPGDYLTHDLTGVPILVVRADSGTLRAFINVCRHRGAKVAQGCGRGQRDFMCPYHGWTYDLGGRLQSMATAQGFEGVARETRGLTPLLVVERHGLIWVQPTPGESFDPDTLLGGMGQHLAPYGWAGYHHHVTHLLRPHMNWKLVVDTFLENWHVSVLHKKTVGRVLHSKIGVFEQFGRNLRLIYPLRSIHELRQTPEAEWDLNKYVLTVHLVFPNTVLVMVRDHLETWRIFPASTSPDESVLQVSLYTPEPATSESAKSYWSRMFAQMLGTVNEEDFPVGEDIQRGFHTGAQDHIMFGRHEPALAHFHQVVKEGLGSETK